MNVLKFSTVRNLLIRDNKFISESRLLLMNILGFSRVDLISKSNYELTELELVEYNQGMDKVAQGYPIHLILGRKEFYSRDFFVTQDTLIPRPETELLVEYVINLAQTKKLFNILDLGTGSGCIAITLQLELNNQAQITAVDINSATLEVAMKNALKHDAKINFIESNWYQDINHKFDIIVSNPPYIAVDDKHLDNLTYEPIGALTDFQDGYSCLRHIISHAPTYLNDHGFLLVEHGFEQKEVVQKIFGLYGFINIKTFSDYANLDRFTVAEYKR